jgi:hypothetical protein
MDGMKKKNIVFVLVAATIGLTALYLLVSGGLMLCATSQHVTGSDRSQGKVVGSICTICGDQIDPMRVATIGLINETREYCCPNCAALDYQALKRSGRDVKFVHVSEYDTGEQVDAFSATYVSGTGKECEVSVVAFSSKEDARAYAEGHEGTLVENPFISGPSMVMDGEECNHISSQIHWGRLIPSFRFSLP